MAFGYDQHAFFLESEEIRRCTCCITDQQNEFMFEVKHFRCMGIVTIQNRTEKENWTKEIHSSKLTSFNYSTNWSATE